jgi:hypothetical protein
MEYPEEAISEGEERTRLYQGGKRVIHSPPTDARCFNDDKKTSKLGRHVTRTRTGHIFYVKLVSQSKDCFCRLSRKHFSQGVLVAL